MEPRISLITLGVDDVARARAFYEKLGFKASSASQADVVFFQLGGLALGLWSWRLLAEDGRVAPDGVGSGRVAGAKTVRQRHDVDAVLAEAEAAGGRITKPAEDSPHFEGRTGYFTDPDNHLWEVAWNPGFALAEDGALILPA
jgi:predicted lactoylglutathione lyase